MSTSPAIDREAVVAMLAGLGDRRPQDVGEDIDSLALAWLVHEVSVRYGVRLDDDALDRMFTVTAAVETIRQAVGDVRTG